MSSRTDVRVGTRLVVGISDSGQIMNDPFGPNPFALASIEGGVRYEHLAIGVPQEGYGIYYTVGGVEHVAYDVFQLSSNITPAAPGSAVILRDTSEEFIKQTENSTTDGQLKIRQTFSFSMHSTRVVVKMEIENLGGRPGTDLTNVLVKRYADLDVDTGPTGSPQGWAGFLNHWDLNRDSIMAYNQPTEAPKGLLSHVVNMVAMPSDCPLDAALAGRLGANQFAQRANPSLFAGFPTGRLDGCGILQWHASTMRVGESLRFSMYYDAYCTHTDIPGSALRGGVIGVAGGLTAEEAVSIAPAASAQLVKP